VRNVDSEGSRYAPVACALTRVCCSDALQCDKRLPGCRRCETYSCPCPGYATGHKFLDEGIGLRRKFRRLSQNEDSTTCASTDRPPIDDSHPVKDVQDTKSAPSLLEEPPTNGQTFSHNPDPSLDLDHGVPVFPEFDDFQFDPTFFDLDPATYYATGNNSCGFLPNVPPVGPDMSMTPSELSGTITSRSPDGRA